MNDTLELKSRIMAALKFQQEFFEGRGRAIVFAYPGRQSEDNPNRVIHTLKSETELREEIDRVRSQAPLKLSDYKGGVYYSQAQIEQTGYLDGLEYCLRFGYVEPIPNILLPGLPRAPETFAQLVFHERYFSGGRGGAYWLACEHNLDLVEMQDYIKWRRELAAEAEGGMRLGASPRIWSEGYLAEIPRVLDLIERMRAGEAFPMLEPLAGAEG